MGIRSNPHKEGEPQYSPGLMIGLEQASCDTMKLVDAALKGLSQIYREGY
ncbi:MAG: hypothetical protein K2X81_26970 [Candidatus Obscuribacterales bacterium]|nr:hypothetical protein [Candidatus Obscuribacterales bacterium]